MNIKDYRISQLANVYIFNRDLQKLLFFIVISKEGKGCFTFTGIAKNAALFVDLS